MTPVLIAEYKRKSPWAGNISSEKLTDAIKRFEDYGAAGISIIVESAWGGSLADLFVARRSTDLPILVKGLDYDIERAAEMGADICLTFGGPHATVPSLVEVTTVRETRRALRLGAKAILTNNRDLQTGMVDMGRSAHLAGWIPPEVLHVAASGYSSSAQAPKKADAVLIGAAMMNMPH